MKTLKEKEINIGIVGATGSVGHTFFSLLFERSFPFNEIRLFSSQNSAGTEHSFGKKKYSLNSPHKGSFKGLDLVFFASNEDVSKNWAYEALKEEAYVIDNSSYFRMNPSHHLVVPEINENLLMNLKNKIIASPNCSTVQLVLLLHPLHKFFEVQRVHVASYQSVSGAGKKAEKELLNQIKCFQTFYKQSMDLKDSFSLTSSFQDKINQNKNPSPFPVPLAFNCIPQIGSFNAEGYCGEEEKIMNETKKILDLPDLKISAFTVRVPSWNAHGEAVWVRLKKKVSEEEILDCLEKSNSSLKIFSSKKSKHKVQNKLNKTNNRNDKKMTQFPYPHPLERSGKDTVGVGRIHRDLSDDKTWIFWVVGDNLRKGAALNAIQIAESLFKIRPKKEPHEKRTKSRFSKDQTNACL